MIPASPSPSAEGGARLEIGVGPRLAERLFPGSSLAVAGVCLTVTERMTAGCRVDLSPETLARTTLGALAAGDEVNLEPPLRVGDPLGGHWVQGHVDGTAEVLAVREQGENRVVEIALPPDLAGYVVEKGSIAVDGVSLTVAARSDDRFVVALVPYTLEVTTLDRLAPGRRVNLEADILAKYVERALAARVPVRR